MATQQDNILGEIDKAWRELQAALGLVPPKRMSVPGVVGSWSVKDLIGHIKTWESEAMKSIQHYLLHNGLEMLAWPDVDEFNERTVRGKRGTPLANVLADFKKTHEEMVQFVRNITEETLDVPEVAKRIRVDTSEHYAEHTENIHKWLDEAASS